MNTLEPDLGCGYEIHVEGELDIGWSEWFSGMEIRIEGGLTILTGKVADQAALYGLLVKIMNLGLPLVFLRRLRE